MKVKAAVTTLTRLGCQRGDDDNDVDDEAEIVYARQKRWAQTEDRKEVFPTSQASGFMFELSWYQGDERAQQEPNRPCAA